FFFSSRRRHTRFSRDWSSDVCSSDLALEPRARPLRLHRAGLGRVQGRDLRLRAVQRAAAGAAAPRARRRRLGARGRAGPRREAGATGGGGVTDAAVSGGRPDRPRGGWPLWEVFVRGKRGLNHVHVGSVHAPDAEMALRNARDLYTRRNEGVSIWVVKASDITASSPSE